MVAFSKPNIEMTVNDIDTRFMNEKYIDPNIITQPLNLIQCSSYTYCPTETVQITLNGAHHVVKELWTVLEIFIYRNIM